MFGGHVILTLAYRYRNSSKAWDNLQKESSLRDRVYIPKVYSEIGSKRIMVAEWIEGVQLTALDDLKEIGASPTQAMQITIEAFASQIFKSGFVHGEYIRANAEKVVRRANDGPFGQSHTKGDNHCIFR